MLWKYDNWSASPCFSSKMESHHHAHHHGHHHGPPQAGGGAEGGTGTGKANGGPQHSVWVVRCNNIIICRCPSYPLYPYIITLSQVLNPVTKSRSFFCSHALGMPAKSRGTTQHIQHLDLELQMQYINNLYGPAPRSNQSTGINTN